MARRSDRESAAVEILREFFDGGVGDDHLVARSRTSEWSRGFFVQIRAIRSPHQAERGVDPADRRIADRELRRHPENRRVARKTNRIRRQRVSREGLSMKEAPVPPGMNMPPSPHMSSVSASNRAARRKAKLGEIDHRRGQHEPLKRRSFRECAVRARSPRPWNGPAQTRAAADRSTPVR